LTAIATMASEVLALAQKDEDLLETAVREHSRLVYRIAYSVLRDHADAEDATQETFLRVLRYEKKFAWFGGRSQFEASISTGSHRDAAEVK
jgi:DNA-directed RNA polymerase specialized sigma24 family protein